MRVCLHARPKGEERGHVRFARSAQPIPQSRVMSSSDSDDGGMAGGLKRKAGEALNPTDRIIKCAPCRCLPAAHCMHEPAAMCEPATAASRSCSARRAALLTAVCPRAAHARRTRTHATPRAHAGTSWRLRMPRRGSSRSGASRARRSLRLRRRRVGVRACAAAGVARACHARTHMPPHRTLLELAGGPVKESLMGMAKTQRALGRKVRARGRAAPEHVCCFGWSPARLCACMLRVLGRARSGARPRGAPHALCACMRAGGPCKGGRGRCGSDGH